LPKKRIYPAININRSGTRREEYLVIPTPCKKPGSCAKSCNPWIETAASEFLIGKLKDFKTNAEFFDSMKR